MMREFDVTITLAYDYEPADPEVGIYDAHIALDDSVLDRLKELAWEHEELLSEDARSLTSRAVLGGQDDT